MFEDIVGGVDKTEGDVANVLVGDGIVTCPTCGSDNIEKGPPIYLITNNTQQKCNCKVCNSVWSLIYNASSRKYEFNLHKGTP